MTASDLPFWKDPEVLFVEEYQPFNLIRDLNGYSADEFDFNFNTPSFETRVVDTNLDDESKENVKENLSTYPEDDCNLYTASSEEKESQLCPIPAVSERGDTQQIVTGNADSVQIRHIFEDGPMITVTKKRLNRILSQRTKRLRFLERRPEFRLPYKARPEVIKYPKRQEMAKSRVRNKLGKFENGGINQELKPTRRKRRT